MVKNLVGIIGFLLLISNLRADQKAFYISPAGNDQWSGRFAEPTTTDDGPFASIDRAMQAVRDLKAQDSLIVPVTVYLRGGLYELNEPIVFTPEDSGTPQAPITYCAYEDESVILSGGKRIVGWQQVDSLWVVDLPQVRDSGWRFQQLYVNGERRFRARTPNTGYFRVKDPMNNPEWPFHHYRYTFGFSPGDLISS
ncbi:MAG: hypothetical protein EHM72_19825, partial [Calditrichaeota bacterium]